MLEQRVRDSFALMFQRPAVSETPAACNRTCMREPMPGYFDSGRLSR